MRIEGTIGIGSVQKPFSALLASHYVDNAANGVCPESDRDYSLIHFYALGEIHGDVVQSERIAYSFLRHSVDKHLHVFAAEAVKGQLHIRTYPARFAKLYSRYFVECIPKGFRGIL